MKKSGHIDSLTGIRMVLMLMILLHHIHLYMASSLFPGVWWLAAVSNNSWIAVDMFFMLSGFVIAYNYADRFELLNAATLRKYLISRVARVVPVHLATTLLMLVLLLLLFGPGLWLDADSSWTAHPLLRRLDLGLGELAKSLLLVQAWSLPTRVSWNTVSWSVSCEWLAYLLFPLLLPIVRKVSASKTLLLALFVAVYLAGLGLALLSFTQQGLNHAGIIRVLSEFIMGMIVFYLYRLRQGKPPAVVPVYALVAGLLLALLSLLSRASFLWLIPAYAWLLLALATGRVAMPVLANRFFVYGGCISYSFYLCHGVVLIFWLLLLPLADVVNAPEWLKMLYISAYVVATVALTLLVYHVVEEPTRRWIIRRLG